MGWFSPSVSNKQALISLLTERTVQVALNVQHTRACLAHCYRGNSFSGVLWSVQELTYEAVPDCPADTVVPQSHRWILCDVMEYRRDSSEGAWWYKPMTEQDEPNAASCPLSYLAMVPEGSTTREAWRERVRLTAAQTATKAKFTKAARKAARQQAVVNSQNYAAWRAARLATNN